MDGIVVIKKQCLEPLDHEFYEHKGLLQRWAEGIRPSIRIGTVHTKKSILVEYLTDPESERQIPATGAMVVECSYQRGLAARSKARELHRISPQDSRGLTELFWEATQSADEFPLARAKPGVAQELQTAGGGQLPETKVTQGSQKPKAKGEALAKKQARSRKQRRRTTRMQMISRGSSAENSRATCELQALLTSGVQKSTTTPMLESGRRHHWEKCISITIGSCWKLSFAPSRSSRRRCCPNKRSTHDSES